ncbi:MAG: hypothetical protein DMF25_09360 [Verrucomicrobia bacterium]|nr:MAG: hypothetical protein DMF25_09360 [Verrucomicrobiota bacterium]
MKNIFILTKAEQRAVIVIVMALLAATIAKRFLEDRSPIPAPTSPSTHAVPTPSPSHAEEDAPGPDENP